MTIIHRGLFIFANMVSERKVDKVYSLKVQYALYQHKNYLQSFLRLETYFVLGGIPKNSGLA